MRTMLGTTLVLLGLACGVARAGDSSSVQYTRDGVATLVQKDLNGERWAITYTIETGHVTGNVLRDNGSATFLDCDRTEARNDGTGVFSCYSAERCGGTCGPDAWAFLTETELPLSFFFPPASDAFCCEITLPNDATTCFAQGPSPQACVTVGSGRFFSESTCERSSKACPLEVPLENCFIGSCTPLP